MPTDPTSASDSRRASASRRLVTRRDPRRQQLSLAIALGAAGVSVLLYFLLRPLHTPPRPATSATLSAPARSTASTTPARDADAVKSAPAPTNASATSSDAFPDIDQLNSPATSVRDDLTLLSNVFASWQTFFPRDGNPWGDNRDITAVLSGKNARRVALIPPNHPAISPDGELLDRWGTPLLFHQLSGTAMELRSAGPDRIFYTADDTVLTP
jgi:hypothetical protein